MLRKPAGEAPAPSLVPAWDSKWTTLAGGSLLAAGVIAAYHASFSVPLLFDDGISLTDNPSIRHWWPLGPVLSPPNSAGVGGRPLLNLSYALNFAAGGAAVSGYHLVNLLIHVLAGWTLFAIVRRTLRCARLAERFGADATGLALGVSAIWALHPVQTEAVTYLSQRAESLMGLFYLLTIYCFIRYAEGETLARSATICSGTRQRFVAGCWAGLSVLACLLGVATKEVIVTAPLLVFLYDRTFVSGSFPAAWKRHRLLYLALAATWIPLGWLMIGLHERFVGFGQGVAGWAYGLTECRVIVKYLGLALWPRPLIFDYGIYVATPLSEVWPYVLILGSLLAVTGWAFLGCPVERGGVRLRPLGYGGQALGFAGAWFFLILAPTSSIVPIVGAPMAESRLYLPLAGVVALAVLGTYAWAGRRSMPIFALVAVGLGVASARRNLTYTSKQAIWSDTVAKEPANARAHNNLGDAWSKMPDRLPDAIAQFKEALRLQPNFFMAHNNLGDVWANMPGRLNDGIAEFEEALRLKPDFAEAHNNLGNAWAKVPGRMNDAVAEYEKALRLRPDLFMAHYNLGAAWAKMPGRLNDAISEYEKTLALEPDYAEAHNNLGTAWAKVPGRLDDAIAQFQEALRLQPDSAAAHNNLGNAWLQVPGRLQDAVAQFKEAVRLQPDFADAHYNLGAAWAKVPGRTKDAVAEYEEALRLEPDFADAHNNLGDLWAGMPGRLNEAIAQFEAALRLKPDFAEAHNNLGNALTGVPGRLNDAIAQFQEALRLQPDYVEAHYNLGNIWFNLPGRMNDAIAEYEQALRLKPDYAEAHNNLGNAWLRVPGRMNEAIAEYEKALRLQPDYVAAHFNLAVALLDRPGHVDEAKGHLDAVLRLQPDNEPARRLLEMIRTAPP